MASPRLKDNCQEVTLVFTRILALVTVVLVVGTAAWITAVVAGASWGFAGAIGGATAGLAGFFMLICGAMFEVKSFTCPSCGHTDRTLQDIGFYNCFNCDTKFYTYGKETTTLNA